MKDIKELIYAAIEENALKFQEIVNSQLQVRAYDAIEALRPEIGASMFGESSHKKMDDEDEEDMEDMEDEEDEDEDEMDDKKKSMKEALHPNQQKIDVVDDEKIDAKDFAKLRKTKNEETQKNIFRNPNLPAKDQLKNPPKQIKVEEDVEELDELSAEFLARAGKAASARSDDFASERNRIAKMPHQQRDAPERAAKMKTYDKASNHYAGLANKISRHKSNMADKLKAKSMQSKLPARMKNTSEEVEQFDEKIKIFQRDQNPNPQRGYVGTPVYYPKGHSAHGDAHRAIVAKAAKASRREGSLKGSDKSTWRRQNDNHQLHAGKEVGEEVVNEVAMPKNAADWQAMINHQIKVTGHPVATDVQFRAPHGKDTSKIASQHSPEDMLNYATAQGGTVKQ